MSLLDAKRVTLKLGKYGTAPATALSDHLLLGQVQAYRRLAGARMQAMDRVAMVNKIPDADYFISRKIDGEFTMVIYKDGDLFTLNPGGTVRVGLPFFEELEAKLKKDGVKDAMIAGELYVASNDDKRPRVHDVSRVARKPENEEQLNQLRFAVFDMVSVNGEPASSEYAKTWERIDGLFKDGETVHPVETLTGKSRDIHEKFESWVDEEGAEGVVARSDQAGTFKIKPRHSMDVSVIGFAEGTDDRSGMLHDLLIAVMRKDGTFQILGRVGGGFTDEQRVDFLGQLRELVVESEYAEVNSDHVAYQMVRPDWVIEISCLDLISETTRGATIDRMVLNWNEDDRSWETARRLPLVSVISPVFQRIREDKTANVTDVRAAQLTDIVEIPLIDKSVDDLAMPKSELLKRVVMTKTLKGATMVRKLLMWKTNKENQTEDFPAYVIHLTDFSPNRKTPMDREVRVSDSEEQMAEIWTQLETKYFVKGWKPPEAE